MKIFAPVLVILALFSGPSCSSEPCHGNYQFQIDFSEVVDPDVITTFSHEINGFSATFEGGLVRDNPAPLGDTWSILPIGETQEGSSTGTGKISMGTPAKLIDIYITAGDDVNARIQFIDTSGSVSSEFHISNGESFTHYNPSYDLPDIVEIKIIIDGGSSETKVWYFNYDDKWEYTCGSGAGSFNIIFILVFTILFYMSNRGRLHSRRTT